MVQGLGSKGILLLGFGVCCVLGLRGPFLFRFRVFQATSRFRVGREEQHVLEFKCFAGQHGRVKFGVVNQHMLKGL